MVHTRGLGVLGLSPSVAIFANAAIYAASTVASAAVPPAASTVASAFTNAVTSSSLRPRNLRGRAGGWARRGVRRMPCGILLRGPACQALPG